MALIVAGATCCRRKTSLGCEVRREERILCNGNSLHVGRHSVSASDVQVDVVIFVNFVVLGILILGCLLFIRYSFVKYHEHISVV